MLRVFLYQFVYYYECYSKRFSGYNTVRIRSGKWNTNTTEKYKIECRLTQINGKQTNGHTERWCRLGPLCEGPDTAGPCQSAGDWNRTGTETGDPVHTKSNTDPRESTLTIAHQLERMRVWRNGLKKIHTGPMTGLITSCCKYCYYERILRHRGLTFSHFWHANFSNCCGCLTIQE